MGRLSLRVAERSGVANGDVETSRRAITDARYEFVAQYVQLEWQSSQTCFSSSGHPLTALRTSGWDG